MEIEKRTEGDVTILVLRGKMLGGDDDELLRDTIEDLVDAGRVNIVLDLAGVPYIDSACLGEIIRSYTTVSQKNGKLKLANLSKRLQGLLSRTRLDWVGGEDSDGETH
jgi:anti-sigma B factor antagonist